MAINVYEMVTNRIIEELEKGYIPWHKPWTGVRSGAYNRISRKPYSMVNQMILKHTGEYATFNQWSKLGGHIRKGEKAEFVVFWKINTTIETNANGEQKEIHIPMLRYYSVFHISQVEGVEPLAEPFNEVTPIDAADQLIVNYVARSGVSFTETESNEAYYSPARDAVVVPMKEQYGHINEYYSTTLHELVHSTGHKTRLARQTAGRVAAFGSQDYSKEELIAEIGSAAIMNRLGIETKRTFTNSVAYIQSWLKVLKNDSRFIVSASSQAEKAVEYIMG